MPVRTGPLLGRRLVSRGITDTVAAAYSFPQNTAVLDDFNRANEGPPLSASWTSIVGGFTVNTSQAVGGASEQYTRWIGSSFNADQEAYVTLATKPGATAKYTGLLLRYNVSTDNGYQLFHVDQAGTDTWEIYKYVSGTGTQLGSTTTGPELAAGDKIGASAIGAALTLYAFSSSAWSTVMTLNDSTFTGAGHIGMYINGTTGRLDNFGGGSIV